MLDKGQLLAMKDTMAMLREVGVNFESNSSAPPSLPVEEEAAETVEIDANGGATMVFSEEEEGTLRSFLRGLTEGTVNCDE
jgi:hypothetical protein